MLKMNQIDNGKPFDWGSTSDDYGKYRDIYPSSFYDSLSSLGFAQEGQSVLDIGTGTGVIARRIYNPSLKITGVDIEENQILKAREMARIEKKDISFYVNPAEETGLEAKGFDSIIAAQCYIYFDVPRLMAEIDRILKPKGRFFISWFCWLPFESKVAKDSEELILKYNPDWKGAGFSQDYKICFDTEPYGFTCDNQIRYREDICFSKEAWAGRIRATRGVGAVLNEKELSLFNEEHEELLKNIPDEELRIPHLVLINSYKRTSEMPS